MLVPRPCALIATAILPALAQTFVRVTDSPVTADALNSGGSTWFDADGDGNLDLFVTNRTVSRDVLYRNGAGMFTRVTTGD